MPIGWEAVLQQGGVVGIAMFALIILQKTWEGRLAEQKTTATEMAEQRKTLLVALTANTAALSDNAAVARESIASSRELCGEVRAVLTTVKRTRKAVQTA